MSDPGELATGISDYLVRVMGLDPALTEKEALFSSGLLDSIDLVEILEFIEERWGITFTAYDVGIEDMDSVERIVTQLRGRGL